MPLTVSTDPPDEPTRSAVLALTDVVEQQDGAPPLSDQARSQVVGTDVAHVVVRDGATVLGYAQRDGVSVEVVATPGAITAAVDAAVLVGDADLRVWTHGRGSRLVEPLRARGYRPVRELFQLRRPLDAEHPLAADPVLPTGVLVRAFVPGADDAAWLTVNADAFAHHAEQGGWGPADLLARLREPWFDAAGFLLAERGSQLLGFHWTKVHPDGLGEVYVLGVASAAQGLGLGSALLVRGERHLADRGCPAILLYVDGDNPAALRLYRKAGYRESDVDVQWAQPV